VSRPLAIPRWSGTVVEPHIQRLLDRYALDLEALHAPGSAEGAVARQAIPREVLTALDGVRAAGASAIAELTDALHASGSPQLPPAVLAGAARDMERRAARLERRVVAAAKREQAGAMRDLSTLRAALLPGGKPQERALNLLPLLARHGPALLSAVRASATEYAREIVGSDAPAPREYDSASPALGARERTR
jgi:uncharacterized protein YllA (UPF0747 family)